MPFKTNAQTGAIKGHLYERFENSDLPFANIILIGKNRASTSDIRGIFLFDSLRSGIYDIQFSYIGYGETTLTNIYVPPDSTIFLQVELPPPCKYDISKKNKTCPICHKKGKVVPILYGLPIGHLNYRKYYYGGCEISFCQPRWYCKRDEYEF